MHTGPGLDLRTDTQVYVCPDLEMEFWAPMSVTFGTKFSLPGHQGVTARDRLLAGCTDRLA